MTAEHAFERAAKLDEADPLREFRDEFVIDDPNLIYLDGNSLGRLPKVAAKIARRVVEEEWAGRLVRGWPDGWIGLPQRLGAKIAQLVGAKANEVLVCDSTSVNLYKLAIAAIRARPGRDRIVTDDSNFPSDIYVLGACAHQTGLRLDVVPPDAIETAVDGRTALLALSHTAFKSGQIHPMERLTQFGHAAGALVLWDLCHSVGAMPVDLNRCGVDLAVGCTYKYLCGGPGSPAFLYVREDLQDELQNPIGGWFGHADPFGFELDYRPAEGLNRFLSGTPPILSMSMVEAGVDLVLRAGIDRIRQKSTGQTEFLIELFHEFLEPMGMVFLSPRDPEIRGSHVSFGHPNAFQIDQALIEEANVVPDFRQPDAIRFGVTPLCTTYPELAEAVMRTREILESGAYKNYPTRRSAVT